jgi:hypothetical protein
MYWICSTSYLSSYKWNSGTIASSLFIYLFIFMFHIKICREHEFAAVEQSVEAFTNILFSSGTTGNLKLKLTSQRFIYLFISFLTLQS